MMIKIENLKFKYKKNKTIFKNVSAYLEKDNIYVLVGENGSGKTTLLKILSHNTNNYTGNIILNNDKSVSIKSISTNMIESEMFLRHLTVIDLVNYIIEINKIKMSDNFKHIYSLLGIKSYEELYIEQLSLGMKQKLYIALTFLEDKKIILLDEPTNSLDLESKIKFLNFLKKIKKNKIIIIASHEADLIIAISQYIVMIQNKSLVFKKSDNNLRYAITTREKINFDKIYNIENYIYDINEYYILTKTISFENLRNLVNLINNNFIITDMRIIYGE